MTSRIVQRPPFGGQFEWCAKLIKQLNERGVNNLTIMVLLEALGVAGLSLHLSEEASESFSRLSSLYQSYPEEEKVFLGLRFTEMDSYDYP